MSGGDFQKTAEKLFEAIVSGVSKRWRLVLLGALFFFATLLAFFGWDVGARLLGVWIMLLSGVSIVVLVVFAFAKSLIGQPDDHKAGARSASVALALLLAALASPEVVSSTAKTLVTSVYTATVYTPQLAATKNAAAEDAAEGVKRTKGKKPGEETITRVKPKSKNVAIDMYGNQANAELFANLSLLIYDATKDSKADSAAWIWFFFVFAAILFLARALVQSYDAMAPEELGQKAETASLANSPAPTDPGARSRPKPGSRPPLMNYPKWLALCLYASILVPATYFALGALLKLGLDSQGTEISAVHAQLREAGAAAMEASPGSQVDLDKIAGKLQRFRLAANAPPSPPKEGQGASTPVPAGYIDALTNADKAVTDARVLTTGLETWRAGYEFAALRQATSFKRVATANQFSDHVSALSAQYRSYILMARSEIRACMIGLSDLEAGFGDKTPGAIQPELAAGIAKRCAKAKGVLDRVARLPVPVVCSETCAINAASSAPMTDSGCLACQGGAMNNVLYGWMADISDSAVLIVGLIGFGLFGAAIRMLGRPDDATIVTEADFTLARMERDAEHARLKEKGQVRLDAATRYEAAKTKYDDTFKRLDVKVAKNQTTLETLAKERDKAQADVEAAQKDENDAKAAASKADTALAALDRQAAEGRSNFVVERVEDGKREYVISGAPAKVFVSGLGAAFTVFLAGKAGVQIFTEGGRTSPTGLLLACFVGAVFAENIWRAVSDAMVKRTPPPPPKRTEP